MISGGDALVIGCIAPEWSRWSRWWLGCHAASVIDGVVVKVWSEEPSHAHSCTRVDRPVSTSIEIGKLNDHHLTAFYEIQRVVAKTADDITVDYHR